MTMNFVASCNGWVRSIRVLYEIGSLRFYWRTLESYNRLRGGDGEGLK